MSVTRRKFLQGCCAGIVAMSGAKLGNLVFAQSAPGNGQDIIINIFLRGGMDALSYLAPYSDTNYHVARPVLGLSDTQVLDLNGQFGLHPSAAPLKELYDANHLALVTACGLPNASRSHFDAQDTMDRGAMDKTYYGGWLGRYLAYAPGDGIFKGVSQGTTISRSMEGFDEALALDGPEGFTLQGSDNQKDDLRLALRRMYEADAELGAVATRTLDATDLVEYADPGSYVPGNGVVYPDTDTGRAMMSVAQMIRLEMGLQGATVDVGGWDTHEHQTDWDDPADGYFADQVAELSGALNAFWKDLSAWHGKLTVVVMSEFGRRLKENDNRGTDHGHGSVMTVLSASLKSKGVFGTWPGLAYEQLFQNVDLDVTTDFRTVLSEIFQARTTGADLNRIFPGFNYAGGLGLFPVKNAVEPESWMMYG